MYRPEEIASLEAFWRMKRGQRLLPGRDDFTPLALRGWLGNIGKVTVERGPADAMRFRVTLSGTRLDDYRGHSITGQYIDEICYTTNTLPYYETCVATREPVHFLHDNSANSAIYATMSKLLLPLGDDGVTVDRILVAIYPLKASNDPHVPEVIYARAG